MVEVTEEVKKARKDYYQKNKAKLKQKYLDNKDTAIEYGKNYYKEHREKMLKRANDAYTKKEKQLDGSGLSCYEKNKLTLKEYQLSYYEKNKDAMLAKTKEYRAINRESLLAKGVVYRINNKEKIKDTERKNRGKYREKRNESCKLYRRRKKIEDPIFRTGLNIADLIRKSMKGFKLFRCRSVEEILGCTIIEFRSHIESQFEVWQSWDNYGNWNGMPTERGVAWDLDHIVPMCTATTEDEVVRLNHYTNFQPLCSYINRFVKQGSTTYIKENETIGN